jgi:methyl-accepting chemotaxis protein
MDEVTQQNAALVEEAAAAADSMREQAQGLAKAVSIFKLDVPTINERKVANPELRQFRSSPATVASHNKQQKLAKVNADEDWEEF